MDLPEDGLTTQTPTLRDTISDAVDASETSATSAPATTSQTAEGTEQQTVAEPVEKTGRTAGRARDEHGKLLPGKAVKQESAPIVPDAPPAPKLARPSSWKKDFEPHWEKLTTGQPLTADEARALAEYNIQRENEFAKGVSSYKSEWDNAKPVLDAIAPFMQDMQQNNIQPAQMVGRLMHAHRQLALGSEQEKLGMFQSLLPQYGIKAQLAVQDAQGNWQLLGQMPAPQAQQQPQPAIQPQDIQRMVREQLQAERTTQSVQEFSAAKDDAGNPRYPHYEAVRNDMALLLEAGKAQDLPSAYDMALRLHDDLWKQKQASEIATATQAATQRRAVDVAKSNVISVKSATPASAGASGAKGIRAALNNAFDEHASGNTV